MAKVCKPSLHEELVAYERLSRAQDERALASGKISAEELFKRNFFFEGRPIVVSLARLRCRADERKNDRASAKLFGHLSLSASFSPVPAPS